jgi:hypothetical protein
MPDQVPAPVQWDCEEPELLLQLQPELDTPLSPDEIVTVTPIAPNFIASVLKEFRIPTGTSCSMVPQDIELAFGGLATKILCSEQRK